MARIPARNRRDWPDFGVRRELIVMPERKRILGIGFPSGELIAAARATGAASVFSGSSEVPTSRIVHLVLPVALLALRSSRLRRSLSDGSEAKAWFRAEDGTDFTIAAAVEATLRLLNGDARAGASTPGGLFGRQIVIVVEAEISPLRDLIFHFSRLAAASLKLSG